MNIEFQDSLNLMNIQVSKMILTDSKLLILNKDSSLVGKSNVVLY